MFQGSYMNNHFISKHWPLIVFAVEFISREKIMYYNPLIQRSPLKYSIFFYIYRRGFCMIYYVHGPQNSFFMTSPKHGKAGIWSSKLRDETWELFLYAWKYWEDNSGEENILTLVSSFTLKMLAEIVIWDKLLT